MHPRSAVIAFLLVPLATSATLAQSPPPAHVASAPAPRVVIEGTVVDPDGAAIAGARVELVAVRNGYRVSARTRDDGRFTLSAGEGSYDVRIEAAGFAPSTQRLDLRAPGPLAREFALAIAGIREDVTITAPAPVHGPTVFSSTKTATPLLDVPQSISVISRATIQDQLMTSVADVVRYVPGISAHQGENNRDQVIIRGNSSSADFFVDGVRDDVQYYRDLYNVDRVEALKGPNAMIFGRGGGGGVINRVTKEAIFEPVHDVALVAGSFGHKRFSVDLGQPAGTRTAFRVNAMYENSNSFRRGVDLERYGINPTVTLLAGTSTHVTLGYERFHDGRVADRGIPSVNGRPVDLDIRAFFGNPNDSSVRADVDLATAAIEHAHGKLTIRNRILGGNYDRGYQNYVPGAVTADGTLSALTAYNNHTQRLNVFNQTDLTYPVRTGAVRHLLLAGAEIGRQVTDNRRNTGYFDNTVTSILVPLESPTITTPVTFRPSATDADNHVMTSVVGAYVQDQIDLSAHVHALAGIRFDRFDLRYRNNRNGDDLGRVDSLVSPRVGLVFKPAASASVYGSYTVSFLPSAGDQFSSLTTITQQVKPERFANYEVGAKWNPTPDLALTTAVYRLDRTNTRATDPNEPTRIVQTGSQRSDGWEVGVNGRLTSRWQLVGGYAYQDARVTTATVAARAGARVAQVPRRSWSLWNLYQPHPRVGTGVGLVRRTDVFAAIDNTVVLPGYTDVDVAVYVFLTQHSRIQMNVDNLFDRVYYVNADNNTNISPGAPRTVRIALTTGF